MKVLFVVLLSAVCFTNTLVRAGRDTPFSTTPQPRFNASSNKCIYLIDNEELTLKSYDQCQEETGFFANSSSNGTSSPFLEAEENGYEDNCFSKCFLTKLKLVKKSGKIDKDDIKKILKSNAPKHVEKERMKGIKNCAESIAKYVKSQRTELKSSCKFYMQFLACVIKSEHAIHKTCRSGEKHIQPQSNFSGQNQSQSHSSTG